MTFNLDQLYHVYNRGNNQQPIFFSDTNYLFFLQKARKHLLPVCDILNYWLMPNHFHFLIYATQKTLQTKMIGKQEKNVLPEGFKNLLSSYAQPVNKKNSKTGSLFQQNTKAKCVSNGSIHYAPVCFHYIHQNPWKAGIVDKMENWKFSSFVDFAGLRNGTLCNKQLAYQLLGLDAARFYKDSYKIADDDMLENIF